MRVTLDSNDSDIYAAPYTCVIFEREENYRERTLEAHRKDYLTKINSTCMKQF